MEKGYLYKKREILNKIKNNPDSAVEILRSSSQELQSDVDVALAAIEAEYGDDYDQIYELDDQFLRDNPFLLAGVVKKDWTFLNLASMILKDNKKLLREITLVAIDENAFALSYAIDEFKDDKEIVKKAIIKNSSTIGFASPRLQKDSEILSLLLYDKELLQSVYEDYHKGYGKEFLATYVEDNIDEYDIGDLSSEELRISIEHGWSVETASKEIVSDIRLLSHLMHSFYKNIEEKKQTLSEHDVFSLLEPLMWHLDNEPYNDPRKLRYYQLCFDILQKTILRYNEYKEFFDYPEDLLSTYAKLNIKINDISKQKEHINTDESLGGRKM